MEPTPIPEVNDLLRTLTDGVQEALGDHFVATVLQGSFAVGDFDENSDVDFIVATGAWPSPAQVESLEALHNRLRDLPTPWAAHLEGSYIPVEILRTCARRDEPVIYFDRGHRKAALDTHCNTAVVRQVVRQHGIRLAGVEPASLVGPVPVAVLRAEIFTRLSAWGREVLAQPGQWSVRFYQGFLVLNYCRAWCDLATGTVGSKRRGAEWAKERVPLAWAGLIDRAWATRIDTARTWNLPADPADYRLTLEFLAWLLERWETEYGDLRTGG